MPEHSRVARSVRVGAITFAVGLLLAFLPVPNMSFVEASFGTFAPFPPVREAGAAELDAMEDVLDVELVGDRVVGTEDGTDEFAMIGVSLDEVPAEPVLIRVREADGNWSEWIELEYESDSQPDPGSDEQASITTEPVWVGDASGYELSIAAGEEKGASVAIVRERTERVVTESVPLAEAAPVPAPFPVNPRSSWNVRPSPTLSSASSLGMAVVHHTASSNNYSSAQVPGIIRSMQAYHMDTNRWSDIGYNFIVDKFGGIWEGRSGSMNNAVIGAHAAGFNTGSVGVSTIGNYVGTSPTAASIEATARVIGWRFSEFGLDPRARANFTSLGSNTIPRDRVVNLPVVVGHRDVGATACPGAIYNSMTTIRNRAHDWSRSIATSHNPRGAVDGITAGNGIITTAGWAFDPDTREPIRVTMIVRGKWHTATANRPRADWASHYATYSNRHGFAIGIDVPAGSHTVCVVALNAGPGRDTFLRCEDVVVK